MPESFALSRRLPAVVLAVALLAGSLIAAPTAASAATVTGSSLLASLRVANPSTIAYDRAYFPHWIDEDGDGCDTRREVLIAESTVAPVVGSGCSVTGRWTSLYDGVIATSITVLDIDHVVALREAWVSGAHAWTTNQRRAFANDLGDARSLRAVTSATNQSKSASDPAGWLPATGVCEFVLDWVAVKHRWSLSIDSAEKSAIGSVLAGSCGTTSVTAPVVVAGLADGDAGGDGLVTGFADGIHRRSGSDRYTTALSISASFGSGVPVLYVATGANFPDALSAAPAAAAQGGPLLLVPPTGPTSAILAEIRRLAPKRIVVVGGESVVSASTYRALSGLAPAIRRDAGADRYATSRVIITRAFASAPEVFVATGRNFPDALSASAAAGSLGSPVLLIDGNSRSVPSVATSLITTLGADRVRIVGGTSVVSSGIESALASKYGRSAVLRHAGADRYATSAAVNRAVFSTAPTAFFAVGATFPDALAGAALAGALDSPLYVVAKSCVPGPVLDHVLELNPGSRVMLGGTSVLTTEVGKLVECSAAAPPPPPSTTPSNPGDSKNCGDFSTQAEAQAWYAKYFPYYGDIANLDGNDNDGRVCEALP